MKAEAENRKGVDAQSASLLRVCEIYESIQGEGLLTGTPSVFVRTSGCNLRCWFCDTPFASWQPEGQHLSWDEIDHQSRKFPASHVVLTGGEPLIFKSVSTLCQALRHGKRHLTIETAGTLHRDVECDLMSISPKLSSSAPKQTASTWHRVHQSRRERLDVVWTYMQNYAYQLKFVVNNEEDALEVLRYLDLLPDYDGERVLLMPQGTEAESLKRQAEWLIPWCRKYGLRFCPRDHITWFGNRRGT
ncbi:MAG: 7-carboxy-7-deazaguanine synthase QueE [bacterium]|nr:7-carboxy-7-deazaguanine synthase QueE [bacterium]